MNKLLSAKIKRLFSNLCCSVCKNEFDEQSLCVEKQEKGLLTGNLSCKYCGKDFGKVFIGIPNLNSKTEPAEIQDGPEAINYDDVIAAHRFIKELDKNWKKYLPKDYKG